MIPLRLLRLSNDQTSQDEKIYNSLAVSVSLFITFSGLEILPSAVRFLVLSHSTLKSSVTSKRAGLGKAGADAEGPLGATTCWGEEVSRSSGTGGDDCPSTADTQSELEGPRPRPGRSIIPAWRWVVVIWERASYLDPAPTTTVVEKSQKLGPSGIAHITAMTPPHGPFYICFHFSETRMY